jgi:magnesium transporter
VDPAGVRPASPGERLGCRQKMEKRFMSLSSMPDAAALVASLANQHVAETVEILNGLEPGLAAAVLEKMPARGAAHILGQPGFDHPQRLIEQLPLDRAAAILAAMLADRRADIFRKMTEPRRDSLCARLDEPMRRSLMELLSYPPRSAGGIMTTEFVSVPVDWTAACALEHIRAVGAASETIYAVYVVDPRDGALLRALSLRQLILSDPQASVAEIGPPRKPVTVSPQTDRADVARLISKYDLLAVPVVDAAGRVLGIVTVDDVIDAIVEEDTEDAQKFGGMEALEQPYMQIGFAAMIKKRAGWLCALFLSEMLTASAMQSFQSELEKAVVLTLFIPLIMSSGGNSGSQATSLIIRALALGELRLRDWWRVALRELPAGVTLGAILGSLGIVRIALWQLVGFYDYGPHWALIALAVGMALVGIVTFGSMSGSMLPLILKRIGFDPASASAPFVATLVDVSGLVIYFSIAYVILQGTLL